MLRGSNINNFHVYSWLIKDAAWCLQLKWLAIFMLFPTLVLSIIVLFQDSKNRFENLILFFWVTMNAAWMLHEFLEWPYFLVFIPISLGFLLIFIKFLRKIN
jgi:hypothetical protein